MNIRQFVPLALGMCVLPVLAEDYVIPANTTFDFLSTIKSSTPVANPSNSISHTLVLGDGCTVRFKTPESGTVYAIFSHWVVQGNVTFDFDGWNRDSVPTFRGCIMMDQDATVTLARSGEDAFAIDLGNSDGGLEENSFTSDLNMIDDLAGLRIGREGISVNLRYPVVLRSLPTDSTTYAALNPVAGNTLFFMGTDALRIVEKDGKIDYDGTVCFLDESVRPEGGLSIASGGRVVILPATIGARTDVSRYCERFITRVSGGDWDPVEIAALGAGASVQALKGVPLTFAEGVSAWGYTCEGTNEAFQVESGSTVSVKGKGISGPTAKFYATADGVSFTGAKADSAPLVFDADVTVDSTDADGATVYVNGGTTEIRPIRDSVCGLVPYYWLDATVVESLATTGARTGKVTDANKNYAKSLYVDPLWDEGGTRYLLVEQWCDCRDANPPYGNYYGFMRVVMYGTSAAALQTLPYYFPSGGPNDMPYLCFATKEARFGTIYDAPTGDKVVKDATTLAAASRLEVCKPADDPETAPATTSFSNARTVVMVYGSAHGGGFAPLMSSEDEFRRVGNTLDTPITANANVSMWLNGEAVEANVTKYSGDWDVLTLDTEGVKVMGLGCAKTNGENAGADYAEVLFFTNKLTAAERQSVEWYLARKWGLTSKFATSPVPEKTMTLMGVGTNGTVRVTEDLTVDGSFSGTIDLDAGVNLSIADRTKPGTAADVPSDGLLGWYDPDKVGYETIGSSSKGLSRLYNLCDGTNTENSVILTSQDRNSSRSPYFRTATRGFGASRRWLDYREYRADEGDVLGNVARFQTTPVADGDGAHDTPLTNVRTVVMVQDSCRGGGTPFKEGVTLTPRRATSNWHEKIWPTGTPDAYMNAALRLNGVATTSASGFGGCPEVFTVAASSDMKVGCFGHYSNTEPGNHNGEVHGEILVYDRALDAAELGKVETYLMNKWVNVLPAGYGDLSGATLTGAGNVSAATWSQMPKLGATFSGTATANAADDIAFALGPDGTVSGVIVAPDATLALPATCTATVRIARRAPVGTYTLVDCAGWGGTVWTVSVDCDGGTRTASVSVQDGKIVLTVGKTGFAVIVR